MAKDAKLPFWQVCTVCNRRQYLPDLGHCPCGAKMIDAREHADNAQPTGKAGHNERIKSPEGSPAAGPGK